MSHSIHRLEWILVLVLWFILFACRVKQQDVEILPYSQSFMEATTFSSVQVLVNEHCMTDARILCAPSLRLGNDSRCADPFDPPFVSLLDPYMDLDFCRMTDSGEADMSSGAGADPMRIVIQSALQEAYSFSRLYFRVKGFQSSEVVNHDELRKFVIVTLNSLLAYFSQESVRDFDFQSGEITITLGKWEDTEIIDLLSSIVNDYKSGDDKSLLNSDASKDRFFHECFLDKVQDFIDNPEPKFAPYETMQGISRQGIVENDQLAPCLWHHHDADTLITEGCPVAIDDANIRLQELSIKESSHFDFTFRLQGTYPWMSWVFVLSVALRIGLTKSTKEVVRLRRYLATHVGLSISLWLLASGQGASMFLSSALLSSSVLLGTFMLWVEHKDDAEDEAEERVARPAVYELPLLEETRCDETAASKA